MCISYSVFFSGNVNNWILIFSTNMFLKCSHKMWLIRCMFIALDLISKAWVTLEGGSVSDIGNWSLTSKNLLCRAIQLIQCIGHRNFRFDGGYFELQYISFTCVSGNTAAIWCLLWQTHPAYNVWVRVYSCFITVYSARIFEFEQSY